MIKRLLFICTCLLSVNVAFSQSQEAQRITSVLMTLDGKSADFSRLSGPALPSTRGGSGEACFNVTESLSIDLQNDPDNMQVALDIGAGNAFTGLAWDVNLNAIAPSQVNEARLLFSGNDGGPGIILTPGFGQAVSGSADFSAGMIFDFTDLGFGDPVAGADGLLSLEFFELAGADNFPDATDAIWNDAGNAANCSGIRLICTDQTACDDAVLALAPILDVAPAALDFGSIMVGMDSGEMTTTLSNTGPGTLRVNGIDTATEFTMTGSGTCAATPFNLAAGSSCTVSYIYSPSVAGTVSEQLQIDSNSQGGLTTSITLQGNGLQGALTLTPTAIDFGNHLVGQSSGTQSVTLENTGTAVTTVTAVTAASAPFSITGGSCAATPFSLNIGATCTLEYDFTPTTVGPVSQNLLVESDASTSPDSIDLQGNGIQPDLTLSPTILDLGMQLVGSSGAGQTVTLTNSGTATVTVTGVTAAAAPFAVTAGSCGAAPFSINTGASCTIDYNFSPTAIGAVSQTITITSDAPSSPDTLTLQGAGVQGLLSIAPTPLDFGEHPVSSTSADQSVTLSNTGTAPLTITSIDPASGPFGNSGGSCGATPFTIDTGLTCTLVYNFSPTVAGTAMQNLAVVSNAGNSPGMIALSGNGTQGELQINPAPLDFGEQRVGTTSSAQSLMLSNSGTSAITVTAVSTPAGVFAVSGGSCGSAPFTITITGNCSIDYTFTPAVSGPASESIMFTSDAVVSPVNVTLQGSGIEPLLTVLPASIDFGDQRVADTSAAQTVILRNNGTDTLMVNSISAATAPFTLSGGSCGTAPFSLADSSDCTLAFTFTPTATGAASQMLQINSDAGNSPNTIALTGNGIQGAISITPAPLDFGTQQIGDTSSISSITISNSGTDIVTVSAITAASAPFASVGGTCSTPPFDLAVSAACTIDYVYTPTAAGTASQIVTVTSNGSTSPNSVELRGEGQNGSLSVTPATLDFADQVVGSSSTPLTVMVSNTGTVLVTVSAVTPAAAPFALTGGSCGAAPFTIATGTTCTLDYTFTPAAAGPASQAVTVVTNTPSTPNNGVVNLTGNGIQGALNVSPGLLDFGDQLVNTSSSEQLVTLTNSGTSALTINTISPPTAPFTLTGGNCGAVPFSLATSSSCNLAFTYAPVSTGPDSQALAITSDGSTSPDSLTLQGNGIQPAIQIAPALVDFADVIVGETSDSISTLISNTGTALLTVTSVAASNAPFTATGGTCGAAPFSIAVGENCSLDFSFTPTATGISTQTLTIASDAPNSPASLDLTGNGIQAELAITPAPLDFGDQPVDSSSDPLTLTFSNPGTALLTVSNVDMATEPFSATGGSCGATPFNIAAGSDCTIEYTFSPTSSGPASQLISVSSNAPDSPASVELQGNGIQGELSIEPIPLDFGDQRVGTSSDPESLILSNTGTDTLSITGISEATDPFALIGGSCGELPITIAVDDSCTLDYQFSPTVTGNVSQALSISSDAASSPDTVDLLGNGIQGELAISPSPLDFGDQQIGTTSTAQAITLSNTGTATVDVTELTAATDPFAVTGGTCGPAPFSIDVDTSCTIALSFAPTATGPATQMLILTSNAPSSPDTLTIQGNGVEALLGISPASIDFGAHVLSQNSAIESIVLASTGMADISIDAITAAATPFALEGGTCNTPPFVLAVGTSCTLDYRFTPNQLGTRSQMIVIDSNTNGDADTIQLQGTGIAPELSVSPDLLRFMMTNIGSMAGPFSVDVTNSGSADLTLGTLTVEGSSSDQFVIDMDDCSNATIIPGETCRFDVTYVPTRIGILVSAVIAIQGMGVSFDLVDLIAAGSNEDFIFIDGFE